MIRLCLGSVFKTLSLCKKSREPTDKTLIEDLFDCVTSYTTEEYSAHIKDCTKNLPREISNYFSDVNVSEKLDDIKESCRNVYLQLPDDSRMKATATIVDIIRNDSNLPDVTLGVDPRYKKSIITADNCKIEPIDFLANILISVCKGKNDLKDASGIDELTKAYVEDCMRKASIVLVDSVDQLDDVVQATSSDAAISINTSASDDTSSHQPIQNNYGSVVINNPVNMNFIEHVDTMSFD